MKQSVLLVDDDENLLAGLARIMHTRPFEVYTARNGDEAMQFLKTRDIDVIVADERMPGMSGVELLTWVADNCPDVMRIVLTAYAETGTAIRAINNASVCRFFTKPCNEAGLVVAIQEVLEQKKLRDDSRRRLESSDSQIRELDRIGQNIKFQTRIASRDLQYPIERILDCCRRLEELSDSGQSPESKAIMAEAHRAAAEARRLVMQLQAAAAARTP
jgi:DNA-binding NtrC family response regulator